MDAFTSQLVFRVLEVPLKQERQREEATSSFLTVDPLTFAPHSTCVQCQSNPVFFRYELITSNGSGRGGCCLPCFPELLRAGVKLLG